ncbi:MAG: tyrosine--tRNA ligase [Candidatus Doudnabacteria bacterium]|nr:tyrosine--tRNA ligase [Candidatus Doudnabacteria bacterium]
MNQKTNEILTRTVAEIIDLNHLKKQLDGGKRLRVKLGIDPTSPNLHIGRAVQLWKLREFQELGHQVVFIVGDFTGMVGDTSDKEAERPMLSGQQIKANMKTYLDQAFKILDPKKTEAHYNSEWLSKLGFIEIAKMAQLFGLHEFESREIIAKRLKAGKRVSFHEMMYPLMQGYDSVAVKADVELGGTDQRFNLLAGRTIQPLYAQAPQDIVMTELLEGTDGRKMSSSWGNVINLTDDPNQMFGKTMSIKDDLIIKYFQFTTRVPLDDVKGYEKELKAGTNPSLIKKRLAHELVTLYHGKKAADAAAKEFEKVFSRKEKPTQMTEMKVKSQNIIDLLVETKLAPSKSEARRLVQQKAVKFNDEVIDEWDTMVDLRNGVVLQVGKRKFIKLKV